jgi:hypothetical protein
VAVGGVVASSLWIAQQIQDPYVIDEAAFPFAAKGVATNGTPYFYNGETRPTDLGIWHPPLYVYLLGLWIKLFGFGHIQVRGFGIMCLITTIIFIYKTVKLFSSTNRYAPSIAGIFYCTHYFVLQSNLIPDIDGTLLPLVISFSLYAIAKLLVNLNQRPYTELFLISVSLGFSFSTKLTTPLLLFLPLVVVHFFRSKNIVSSLLLTLAQMILGLFLFLMWWIPISRIQNLDWTFPFRFTFQSAAAKSSGEGLLNQLLNSSQMPMSAISWIGFSTFILFLFASYLTIKVQDSKIKVYSISVLAFSAISWLVYNSITGAPFTFPKYWNIGLIGISISAGLTMPAVQSIKSKKVTLIISLFAITVFAFISWTTHYRLSFTQSFISLNPSVKVSGILIVLILATTFLVRNTVRQKKKIFTYVLLMTSIVSMNAGVSTAISNSSFSTRYYFGESGEKEVLTWLAENSDYRSVLFAAKDIGLESGIRFYEDAQILTSVDEANIPEFIDSSGINLIVIRELYDYSPQIYSAQLAAAVQGFKRVVNSDFGDFQVWEKINE